MRLMAGSSLSVNITETETATVHHGLTNTSLLQVIALSTHQVSYSRWRQKLTMPFSDMLLSIST
jgi:hypothetical protein